VGLRATKAVEAGPLRITAANAREGDAVEKTVRVHPDGEPRSINASRLLRAGSMTLSLDLPADEIPAQSMRNCCSIPTLARIFMHSMKAVLERPYGCGEQTISSTYPSLLFLELLKAQENFAAGGRGAELSATGLRPAARLLGAGGGITYWGSGDEAPDAALTAYGIEFLIEAGPYIKVDQTMIDKSAVWLVANQQADGSWKPHYGETSADHNLYVAEVLHRTSGQRCARQSRPTKDLRER
jgi:uncharacterized protein YfaS (alpha-2-macroglobulin family)